MEKSEPAVLLPPELETKLKEIFSYHPPENDAQLTAYAAIRAEGLRMAAIICKFTPKGSDQSAAIRKLREAIMTANAAIALKGCNF